MSTNPSITERISRFIATHKYEDAEVSSTTFRYLLCGKGEKTIIFLDGGIGTSEAWFEYISYFEKEYQILTFAFPHNLSENIAQVSAIKELMDKLNIAGATFIGVSYGTLLAQLFSKKYPNSVNSLVLLSGGSMNTETKKRLKKYKMMFRLYILSAKILPFKIVRKNIIRDSAENLTNDNDSEEKKSVIEEAVYALYKDCSKQTVMNMSYLLLDTFDTENCSKEDFDFLYNKVLLIFPEKDFFPKQSQDALISLMNDPEVIWIDDGAHGDPMFSEKYIRDVALFLNSRK